MPKLTDKELALLNELSGGPFGSYAELAGAVGRDKGTVAAAVKKLAGLGLIVMESGDVATTKLTELGGQTIDGGGEIPISADAQALVAATLGAPPAPPSDLVGVVHKQIRRSELNPRKDFDSGDAVEALIELANSIAENGLMQNLVLRPDGGLQMLDIFGPGDEGDNWRATYAIVAGERRWRAIGLLIEDGRWPADRPIPCQIREIDDTAHATLALVENLQRRDLKPLEEARQIKAVIESTALGTEAIGKLIGLSQRWVQQRLQLLELPAVQQVALEAGKMTIEQARAAVSNLPKLREDLEPADWLLMLEVFDKVTTRPFEEGSGETTECGEPDAADAERIQRLATYPVYLVGSVHEHRIDGWPDGRRTIGLGYTTSALKTQLRLRFGDDFAKPEVRELALKELRIEVLGLQAAAALPLGAYARAWLNGPFEVDQALLAEAEAEKAQRTASEELRRAAVAEAQAKAAAAWARTETIIAQQREIRAELAATGRTVNGGPSEIAIGGFADLQSELGRPLPWSIDANGNLREAAGEIAVSSGFQPYGSGNAVPPALLARQMLLGTAVNAAGGFGPPELVALAAERMSADGFLNYAANCLVEDWDNLEAAYDADPETAFEQARKAAEAGLEAFKLREGVTFGADGHAWDEDQAAELAREIREDGLGQVAEDPDALSDSLVAMAEGRAGEIAGVEA